MSGAVAQRANGMSKALGGKVTFFYALTRVFFEWDNTEVTVTFADGDERRGRMHDVIVANGVWHGGGMMLAPGAASGVVSVVLDVVRVCMTAPNSLRWHYPDQVRGSAARPGAPRSHSQRCALPCRI